jgi:hypothetical protein
MTYHIVVHREDRRDSREPRTLPEVRNALDKKIPDLTEGIVVRAPAPYRVTVTTVIDNVPFEASQLIFLPDVERDYFVPVDRWPFVKNDTQITLINGVVQKVATTRPSIIFGIVGIPGKILDALIPLKSH